MLIGKISSTWLSQASEVAVEPAGVRLSCIQTGIHTRINAMSSAFWNQEKLSFESIGAEIVFRSVKFLFLIVGRLSITRRSLPPGGQDEA
jgi:hypothetical protein